jgi:hypothetical protein
MLYSRAPGDIKGEPTGAIDTIPISGLHSCFSLNVIVLILSTMIITSLIMMVRGTMRVDRKFGPRTKRLSQTGQLVVKTKKYEGPYFTCDIRLGVRLSQIH